MNRKPKRYLSILLATLMLATMLLSASCGQKPPVPDESIPDNPVSGDNTTDEQGGDDNTVDVGDSTDDATGSEEPGVTDDSTDSDSSDATTDGGNEDDTTGTKTSATSKDKTDTSDKETTKSGEKTTGDTKTTKSTKKTTGNKTSVTSGKKTSSSKTGTNKTTTPSNTVKTTTKSTTVKTNASTSASQSNTTKSTTRWTSGFTTASQSGGPLTYDAFMPTFNGWFVGVSDYTVKDSGSATAGNLKAYRHIIDGANCDYCLHVYTNSKNEVVTATLTAPRKDYEYMYAVFSYYLYQTFGLNESEINDFLDIFESMPAQNNFEKQTVGKYQVHAYTPDEFFTFTVTHTDYKFSNTKAVSDKLAAAQCDHCMNKPNRIFDTMKLTDDCASLGIRADMLEKALVNKGNQARLAKVMNRAKNGEDITFGVIGGSVTEGAYASDYDKTSYAGLTNTWLKGRFPNSDITFVNAGIGGTSSLYGVHRVEQDLLSKNPDLVIIEYGVNDNTSDEQLECYASLVRRVLSHESQPAVILLFVMNEGGTNSQSVQVPVGQHYDLPMISYRDAVWPEVSTKSNLYGQYEWTDIAADWVHPTNKGHAIIAELLISYLSKTYDNLSSISTSVPSLPAPKLPYSYEDAIWLNNTNATVKSLGSFSVYTGGGCAWKSSGNKPIVIEFTGKRVYIPLTSANVENPDVTIRIDGGSAFKMGPALFGGGRYTNYLVFDEDTVGKHTIEITCNSGTLYLGGLFVS